MPTNMNVVATKMQENLSCNSESKPITRTQNDYFGKGLQIFFLKKTFTCEWNFEWDFL